MRILVSQDGGQFYDEETGGELFSVSYPVKDFDMQAAQDAREEFVDWFNRERPNDELVWEN